MQINLEHLEMLASAIDRAIEAALSHTNTKEFTIQTEGRPFQGYKVKFNQSDGTERPGPFDYIWGFYPEESTLRCTLFEGSAVYPALELTGQFFNASKAEQQNIIDDYVKQSLASLLNPAIIAQILKNASESHTIIWF